MTKDEALRLALEVLKRASDAGYSIECEEAITAVEAALEAKDEIDWKDMYEKQKRRSEMWVAKYEKDIGPLEKAGPQQEKNEFNPDWDTQAVLVEEIQRMAKRIEELEAQTRSGDKDEPVANNWSVFNTGAEVWDKLSLADAVVELTPSRLERGWSAVCVINKDNPPLYTTPPQRTWVGLTHEEIDKIYEAHHNQYGECESVNFGYERAIESKLKEKNELC